MRLIDGDALKESLKQSKEACNTWYDNCDSDMKPRVEQALITFMECIIRVNDMPAIEERKKGKWINANEGEWNTCKVLKCSVCGELDNRMYETDNFCPNCGASMREEKT